MAQTTIDDKITNYGTNNKVTNKQTMAQTTIDDKITNKGQTNTSTDIKSTALLLSLCRLLTVKGWSVLLATFPLHPLQQSHLQTVKQRQCL